MFEAELRAAMAAARAAGEEVVRLRQEGVRYGRKHGYELVSEADLRAAEILHHALRPAFPGVGWLSEEHRDSAERLACDRAWIVDPIDGTREYLEGVPEYAVSVGLVVAGTPAIGVVYNPAKDEMFAAACGPSQERPPGRPAHQFEVLVGRGEHRWDELPPLPGGARTRAVGSVAYRLALLASGTGDAVLTGYGRSEWDVAAGAALCAAAGLRVTDILGEPLAFNKRDTQIRGLLVAEPGLHTRLATHFRMLASRAEKEGA